MKRLLAFIFLAVSVAFNCNAQSKNTFYPESRISVLGGINIVPSDAWTMGIGKTITPNFQVGYEYGFLPWLGVRTSVSGMMGSYPTNPYREHQFTAIVNYMQFGADAMFDICNLLEYSQERVINPYVLAGMAANYRFKTGNTQAYVGPAFRGGLGLSIRMGKLFRAILEGQYNALGNKFNTLDDNNSVGGLWDGNFAVLAGVQLDLGGGRRRAQEEAHAREVAEAKARQAAAAQATADRIAAARAADRARSEQLAAEREALARGENPRVIEEKILFETGKTTIPESERPKLEHIVSVMDLYPNTVVTIAGYAGRETEPAADQLTLSVMRADAVKKALTDAGISATRITTRYNSSSQQISTEPGDNQVVVCTTK